MTATEHLQRHQELKKKLCELVADFILHDGGRSDSTVMELLEWTAKQAEGPDHGPH